MEETKKREKFDVVVVGGGLAGSWVAYWLKKRQPSLSVALLEQNSSCLSPSSEWGKEDPQKRDEVEGAKMWETPSLINAGAMSPSYDGGAMIVDRCREVLVQKASTFFSPFVLDGREGEERVGKGVRKYPDLGCSFPRSFYDLMFLLSVAKNSVFPRKVECQVPSRSPFPSLSSPSPSERGNPADWGSIFVRIENISIECHRTLLKEMQQQQQHQLSLLSTCGRYETSLFPPSTSSSLSPPPFSLISKNSSLTPYPQDLILRAPFFMSSFHSLLSTKHNVTLINSSNVTKVVAHEKNVTSLETTTGRIEGKKFIFCVGASADGTMNRWSSGGWGFCLHYPFLPSTSPFSFSLPSSLHSPPFPTPQQTVTISPTFLYVGPYPNSLRVTTGLIIGQKKPSPKRIATCEKAISRRVLASFPPSLSQNLSFSPKVFVAPRPVTPDGYPVVGRHPQFDNAYVLNGLGFYGYTAAVFSHLLCDVMEGKKEKDVVEEYGFSAQALDPSRFRFGDVAFWGRRE